MDAGLFAGLKTIIWAIVLLVICVYAMAILITSIVGQDEHANMKHRKTLFGTMPNSMFTISSCLTEGCVSVDGTPISLHLYRIYGYSFVLMYVTGKVVVTFGLFNFIMAVYVENTIRVAKTNDQKIVAARHVENLRISRKLRSLIRRMFRGQRLPHEVDRPGILGVFGRRTSTPSDEMVGSEAQHDELQEMTREEFDRVFECPAVQQLLDELEIDESERINLFDVLDSDGSETLSIEELVSGIMAVRGQPKK